MKRIIPVLIISFFCCACNDIFIEDGIVAFNDVSVNAYAEKDSLLISYDELISVADVVFNNGAVKGRSMGYDCIDVMYDSHGVPAIYVINNASSGGFVLVSARKTYYPVLAFSNEGSFDQAKTFGYLKEWLGQTAFVVEHSDNLPADSLSYYKKSWQRYEAHQVQNKVKTRSMDPVELRDLQMIIQNKLAVLRAQGYQAYDVVSYANMSSQNRWVLDYRNGIYPEYEEDFENLTYVLIGPSVDSTTNYGVSINCVWTQSSPYNSYFPTLALGRRADVGCVSIAAAIIMKHYNYPASFNWANISYNSYTDELGKLLFNITSNSDPNYSNEGTGITLPNIAKYLGSKGYSASKRDYSQSVLNNEIRAGRPVIIGSTLLPTKEKHAWVVPGGRVISATTTVELWSFPYSRTFAKVDWKTETSQSGMYYYVNWGHAGKMDGFYRSLESIVMPGYTGNKPEEMVYEIKPK